MQQLRIGTRLDMGIGNYEELSSHARLAEMHGYESVWVRDHVSLESTTGQAECFECWTVMSALARDTRRVQIGSLVLCTPFRNPALLAKMGATLDRLSGGRLFLGVGAGHKQSEFAEYGYDFPSPGDRLRMLDEAVQIIRLMWTERRPSFAGKFFRIENALNEPKPVNTPPIMIGASGPRALRVVARLADAWNTPDGVDDYLAKRTVLEQHCRDVGRDPASIRHIVSIALIIDRSESQARRRLDRVLEARPGQQYLRDRIITGTPEQVAERIQPLLDLGIREFITAFWEIDRQPDGIESFATEVKPLLEQRSLAMAR